MKKLILFLFLICMSLLSTQVQAEPDTERDSFRAGQAFARAFWHKLEVHINYEDQNGGYHYMMATTGPTPGVTSVTLDRKIILSESEGVTLPGIPVPKGGMRGAVVYVEGFDKNGALVVNGYKGYDLVDANNPIIITLLPASMMKDIEYDVSNLNLPQGFDLQNLQLINEQGDLIGFYNSWSGGFVLWTDPSVSPFWATITTNTGIRYGSIYVDPLKVNQKNFQGSSVNINLAGNVHRFNLKESGGHFSDNAVSEINGEIERENGQTVQSKVFIVENKWRMPLEFSMYGKVDGTAAKMKISAYYVYPDGVEIAGESCVVGRRYGDGYEISGTLLTQPLPDETASMMYVVEVLSGEPVGEFNFYLHQFHNGTQPVYDGKAVIKKSGFTDEGSVANNDEGTSRDYTFSFEVTADGGDVRIFADEVKTFVEGSGTSKRFASMDSTADEISDAVFVVREGESETFTVTMTVYDVSVSGQYRVGLDSVGSLDLNNYDFRTSYRTINQTSGGKG